MHAHTWKHPHIYMHAYSITRTHSFMDPCMHALIHARIDTCACVHIFSHTCACMCLCSSCNACTQTRTRARAHDCTNASVMKRMHHGLQIYTAAAWGRGGVRPWRTNLSLINTENFREEGSAGYRLLESAKDQPLSVFED